MIPISDLRKGNMIKTEYGILPVHAIIFSEVQVKGKDGRILWAKETEGVGVDEQLLLRFGFNKDSDGCLNLGSLYWIPRGYWGNSGVLQIAVGYSPLINCPCVFSHELQNIYWWFKRKELEFNHE